MADLVPFPEQQLIFLSPLQQFLQSAEAVLSDLSRMQAMPCMVAESFPLQQDIFSFASLFRMQWSPHFSVAAEFAQQGHDVLTWSF